MASFGSRPHRFVIRTVRPVAPPRTFDVDLDLSAPPDAQADVDADEEGGWLASSFDLARGLRVIEAPLDTLPGELQDAFIAKR